jgi:hypothetical protein
MRQSSHNRSAAKRPPLYFLLTISLLLCATFSNLLVVKRYEWSAVVLVAKTNAGMGHPNGSINAETDHLRRMANYWQAVSLVLAALAAPAWLMAIRRKENYWPGSVVVAILLYISVLLIAV